MEGVSQRAAPEAGDGAESSVHADTQLDDVTERLLTMDGILMLRAQTLGFTPVEIFLVLAAFSLVISLSPLRRRVAD